MAKAKVLLGAIIGVAAGFVAGVLTAPKSGKDTREELKKKAEAKKAEAIAKGKEVRHKAGDVAEDVVTKAEKVTGQAADKVVTATGQAAEKVVSATEKAADAVVDTTKELKAKSRGVAKNARTVIEKNK
jgi:gas vesicle protein